MSSKSDGNEATNSDFDELSPQAMLRVNRICDEYESLCNSDRAVSFTHFLKNLPNMSRQENKVLLGELIAIDIHHRRTRGLAWSVGDYVRQVPGLAIDEIEQIAKISSPSLVGWIDSLQKDQVLGDYVIREKIGSGGMGQVYRAEHVLMGRQVAVKILTPNSPGDVMAQRRFEREVRSVAKLSHPNVVSAFDARRERDMLYLVTEWIDGIDLAQRVARHGLLTCDEALHYIRQAAVGLQYAHEQGVIHRDVKPSNLLLDQSGRIKILDLGLAKLILETMDAEAPPDALTKSTQIVGTAAFMSPEQARFPLSVDPRSDIYNLGCTLYFLLTGEVPYKGNTQVDIILAHVSNPIPNVREKNDSVGPAVASLIASMMAKNPDDRPESMKSVIESLTQLIGEPLHDTSSSGQTTRVQNRFLHGPRTLPVDASLTQVDDSSKTKSWQRPLLMRRSVLIGGSSIAAGATGFGLYRNFDWLIGNKRTSLASGLSFDGTASFAEVSTFDIPFDGPGMIEVLATPRDGKFPSNVVAWTGENALILFVSQGAHWGIAMLMNGVPQLLVAEEMIEFGRPYLIGGRWDGRSLQLLMNGLPIDSRELRYNLVSTRPSLCFGGTPPTLFPNDQTSRFFSGNINAVRVSKGQPLHAAVSAKELSEVNPNTAALFELTEGKGSVATDKTRKRWQANIVRPSWIQ